LRLPFAGLVQRFVANITAQAVREALRTKAGVVPAEALDGPGWTTFLLQVGASLGEIRTPEQAFQLVTWVNRAISAIIESSRRAGLLVYKVKPQVKARALAPGWSARHKAEDGKLVPATDPMELLLNPLRDWSCGWDELFEETLGHFLLRGWVGWYCPLVNGKPAAIRVVPRSAVVNVTIARGVIQSYKLLRGSEMIDVPAEELCVMRRWNPANPVEGLSPIDAAMLTADTDRAQTQAGKVLARRGGFQQGHLYTDAPDATEEEARRVQTSFESKYGGPAEAYRTPVLWGGYKWQQTGLTMRQLGFLEARRFNREEIGGLFGVPPIKMGDWSNSYYNSREQARNFWLDAIEPLLKRVQRFLDSQFLDYWDRDLAADWDLADVAELQEDRKEQADIAVALVNGRLLSPNEARDEYLHRPPYAGGDAILAGIGLLPSGTAPRPVPGDESERARKSAVDEAYRRLFRASSRQKQLEVADDPQALARWWQLLNSIMTPQAARLGRLLQARVRDWLKLLDQALLDRATDPIAVLNAEKLAGKLAEDSLPLVRAFYTEAGERAEGVAGAKAVKFDIDAARRAKIAEMVLDWATETTDATIRQAGSEIASRLTAGADIAASHDEIIATLRDLLGSEYRCEMASRTIVQGANNRATLDGWTDSQVVEGKRWLAGPPGERRRPVHQEMSAKGDIYALSDNFVLPNGATGPHPGDIFKGGARALDEIINCGCVMVAALKRL